MAGRTPVVARFVRGADLLPKADRNGSFGNGRLDLFASYSATTAFRIMKLKSQSHGLAARAIRGLGSASGMGETRGAPPDAWSTAYGAMALYNLDDEPPEEWADFLSTLESDGGYAMFPGESADSWATGFVAQALGHFGVARVHRESLARWIGASQAKGGGITWSPGHVLRGAGDVRASGFLIEALRQVDSVDLLGGYLDLEALVRFVADQQDESGGFGLNVDNGPCMWGTGESVAIFDALGLPVPNRATLVDFVMSHFDDTTGGFRRGPAYGPTPDVWACRQAVRVLRVLAQDRLEEIAARVARFLDSCAVPGGGFTYRQADEAGDVLSSAAAVLAGIGSQTTVGWIQECVMPDGGFTYMPGRGAEARTAQWATSAISEAGATYDSYAVLGWAVRSQNPDGGFGRYAGRVSEPVSTAAVVATLDLAGDLGRLPGLPNLAMWLDGAIDRVDSPGPGDAAMAANLVRASVSVAGVTGRPIDVSPGLRVIDRLRLEGGFRRSLRAVPDLATTYAVLVAHQAVGDRSSLAPAQAWLNRLALHPNGVAWSPAAAEGGGLLATALATLIASAANEYTLPVLSL